MKKSLLRLPILAALLTILTACPYESKVPISEPNEELDKALLGKWISSSEREYDNPTYFEIKKYKYDKMKYDVTEWSYSTYDSVYSEKMYLMHTSTVGDKRFMNIQENGEGNYYLHMFEMKDASFTLYEITDNIDETFNSSADLRKFVEQHMNTSFFYASDEKTYYECKKCKNK